MNDAEQRLFDLCHDDKRYHPEAYRQVFEALDLWKESGANGHIGANLLTEYYIRACVEDFGLLASCVLTRWGVRTERDLGNIVFSLIKIKLLIKQESDIIDDFKSDKNMCSQADIMSEKAFESNE